jgi:hypothetical protein
MDGYLEMAHGLGGGRNGKCAPRNAHPAHSPPPLCKENLSTQAAYTYDRPVARACQSPRDLRRRGRGRMSHCRHSSYASRRGKISTPESFEAAERTGEIASIPLPARGVFSHPSRLPTTCNLYELSASFDPSLPQRGAFWSFALTAKLMLPLKQDTMTKNPMFRLL